MRLFNLFTAFIILFSIDSAASDIIDVSIWDTTGDKWILELTFCGSTRRVVVEAPQSRDAEQKLIAALVSQAKKECVK